MRIRILHGLAALRPAISVILGAGMLGFTAQAPLKAEPAGQYCKAGQLNRIQLLAIRDAGFVSSEIAPDDLAVQLSLCLTSADPVLRDEIGYTGLASQLRDQRLSVAMQQRLLQQLRATVGGAGDAGGFAKPFAILVLSEVARADRIKPFMTPGERDGLIKTGCDYLAVLRDYRGFDETDGWRHGVAHSADLMMQLALNLAVNREQLERMMDAVFSQAAAADNHFYIYGEPGRLARSVLFAASRGLISEAKWTALFAGLADPAPFASWDAMFASQAGLARLHNIRLFANALAATLLDKEDPNLIVLKPHVKELRKDMGLL